ncbi:MAG: DUF4010 domain-containing protein [Bryobacteraceae bacterium]
MTPAIPTIPAAATAIAEALLIGFLIGAQRETSQDERHAGIRDFVLIALVGAVCGLIEAAWLTVAALVSITALLVAFYFHVRERTGITTEIAAVATFCLGYLTARPAGSFGAPLAIGTAIAVVAFLEAKQSLHKLIRETITETEFNDTLRFLATIFIIYPLLPEGAFGPFGFLDPKTIWLFVILVSSISYIGYFVEKFVGAQRGMKFLAVFGGLASTTAATTAFARNSTEKPGEQARFSQAAVIANAIQFPRLLVILSVANQALAQDTATMMAVMCIVGLLYSFVVVRVGGKETPAGAVAVGNPFRLWPALKFGAVFAAIVFLSKAAAAMFGGGTVYLTSAIGGSVDADAVVLSVAGLVTSGGVAVGIGSVSVLIALAMNGVIKTAIAFYAGTRPFAWKLAGGFAAMFGSGWLTLWMTGPH